MLENPGEYIPIIREYAQNFKNGHHTPKLIYDGIKRKKRLIIVPNLLEHVVHHMLVQTLIPMFTKGMYEHTYGSIPNRGGYRGMKTLTRWIAKDDTIKYCAKLDIKKFFESIPHDILLEKLSKYIRDKRLMEIIKEIISVSDKGIPLGFYTSQWLANWYLQSLDHHIKEDLKVPYYMRYMDDMILLFPNSKDAHDCVDRVRLYLSENLGLHIKENWQVFRFHYIDSDGRDRGRYIDFMGFRFYRNRVTIRKSIITRIRRKARRVSSKEKPTIHDARQMLSYSGWLKHTDTYDYYLDYVKPYINIQYLKRRVSNYDRRMASHRVSCKT